MDKAILLAVAAGLCTATASVCQRRGAKSSQTAGFDVRLVVRLACQPVWLLGIASMIGGFVFQLTALRFGGLALVQPVLAAELLFVFGYLAVAGSRRVQWRDWLAAAAVSAGIGVFLRLASPSGGQLHAPGSSWLVAGLVIVGVVLAAAAVAFGPGSRPGVSRLRRAAVLGAAAGISWGFMAAVIKELSSHLGDGPGAVFTTWSLYVLIAAGAVTMLLASHALAAGPLAASQPGFTILDPLAASLLGVFLFGEHIRTGAWDLAGQALALAVVIAGASALSRSLGEDGRPSREHQPAVRSAAGAPLATSRAGRIGPGLNGRLCPAEAGKRSWASNLAEGRASQGCEPTHERASAARYGNGRRSGGPGDGAVPGARARPAPPRGDHARRQAGGRGRDPGRLPRPISPLGVARQPRARPGLRPLQCV
jgi:drug/metabolite transporter (DMT)-like permease